MWIDNRAKEGLRLTQAVDEPVVANHGTGHHIVVAGKVFCDAMDYQIDPVGEWLHVHRCCQSGIDGGDDLVALGNLSQTGQIHAAHKGIGGRFGEDQLGVGSNGGFERVVIATGNHGMFNPIAGQKALAKVQGSMVTFTR